MPCPKLVDIAAHALALHHNVLGGQRVGQGVFVLHRQHHVGQRFESVGLVEVEHGGDGCRERGWVGKAACTFSLPLVRYRISVNTNRLRYRDISISITVAIYAADVAT